MIIIIDPVSDKSVGNVDSPRGGEVERFGVWYGFVGGGRACFSPAAKLSNGVVERGGGVGFAFVAAAPLCDGVDKRVSMVGN